MSCRLLSFRDAPRPDPLVAGQQLLGQLYTIANQLQPHVAILMLLVPGEGGARRVQQAGAGGTKDGGQTQAVDWQGKDNRREKPLGF